MRIDLVITELFVGGAEKCLTDLALSLHDRGHHVRVFSLASLPNGEQRQFVDRLEEKGILVETAACDSVWQAWKAYRFLRRRFRECRPDLVQTFLHHANILGAYAAQSADVHHCVAAVRVAQPGRHRNYIERLALKRVDHVLCVSRAVEQFAQHVLHCNPSKTTVIPNGVNLKRFENAPRRNWSDLGWSSSAKVLLFLGRLDPQKGLELLQEQVDQIAPSGSEQKLLLIGDGPLRQTIQTWANQVGSDRVQVLPWQSDVASWLASCDLLVLPSRYEGMPNVLLEAMASTKPVVCSLVEGTEELLGETTALQGFSPGDASEMADRIQNLMKHPEIAYEMGKRNRNRVANDFSLPAFMERYEQFYLSILGEKHQGAR